MSGLVWLFLLLMGCTVGPDYQQPQFITSQQISKNLHLKSSETNFDGDFQKFHDEVLNKLIQLGIKNNLSVRQALAALRAARYALNIEIAALAPTLDANAQYQEIHNSRDMKMLLKEDTYQVGLDASWEIDIFGKQRRTIEQTAAQGAQTLANLENQVTSEVELLPRPCSINY